MTDIEKKALALLNEVRDERGFRLNVEMQREDMAQEALCRAIKQHEAYKQEVSDAIDSSVLTPETEAHLSRFIIPKPDPLVEVINDADDMVRKPDAPSYAEAIRAALAARGLEIREKQP